MNEEELRANPQAVDVVVHDLNADPVLPFAPATFDAVVCCVSVDYLVRPVEVFADVARVLRPGGVYVCTFSNRCFPTKAIRGWLVTGDKQHCAIVAAYFERAGGFDPPTVERRTPASGYGGDPLFAVWSRRRLPEP
jgi:SAM-dependent methyltransferase